MEAIYRQTGIEQERLIIAEDPPQMLYYLYEYFNQLKNTRNIGMSLNAITFEEIKAFNELLKLDLSPFEVDVIRSLDIKFLNFYYSQQKKAK